MDINKIEILLRAIKLGSLSKAADEFLYTPSALSHIADSIEDEIGTKIIRRTHTGIEVLNPEIVDRLQKIADIKKEILSLSEKVVTIGTYSSLSKYILPGITKSFREKYPDVQINIIVVDALSQLLESEKADILFGERQNAEGFVWEEIMRDPYLAVFPPCHNGCDSEFYKGRKYDEVFILPNDQKTINYIDKTNFKDIIKIDSQDDDTIIQMVKAETGISILPELSLRNNENQVKIVPLAPALERKIGLMYKRDCKKEGVWQFISFLKDAVNI